MPNITGTMLGDGKISILQMREKFRDYISMAIVPDTCWQTLKDLCDAYDNGLIFKSNKHRSVELRSSTSNKGKKIKHSMPERPRMFIGWLRPLQNLTTNEHILLCKQLTSDYVDKE